MLVTKEVVRQALVSEVVIASMFRCKKADKDSYSLKLVFIPFSQIYKIVENGTVISAAKPFEVDSIIDEYNRLQERMV